MNEDVLIPGGKNFSKWWLVASALIFVCGILAIILPLTFSFAIALTMGSAVFVGGIAHLVFAFHTRHLGGFLGHMLLFALYELAALCLLVNPLLSIFSLALILAVFLLGEGTLELFLYFRLRRFCHSLWVLIDGFATLILGGVMIWQWPSASPDTIGVLIGLSLILSALSRVILSLAVRALSPASA